MTDAELTALIADLDRLEALEKAATRAPWESAFRENEHGGSACESVVLGQPIGKTALTRVDPNGVVENFSGKEVIILRQTGFIDSGTWATPADFDLIAAARNAFPKLIAAVRELTSRLEDADDVIAAREALANPGERLTQEQVQTKLGLNDEPVRCYKCGRIMVSLETFSDKALWLNAETCEDYHTPECDEGQRQICRAGVKTGPCPELGTNPTELCPACKEEK